MECRVRAEERRELAGEEHAGDHQKSGNDDCRRERMQKSLVRARDVAAPEADRRDGGPADGREQKECVHDHQKRHRDVDRAESVQPYAVADENPVDDGIEKKADAAQDHRDGIVYKCFRARLHFSLLNKRKI